MHTDIQAVFLRRDVSVDVVFADHRLEGVTDPRLPVVLPAAQVLGEPAVFGNNPLAVVEAVLVPFMPVVVAQDAVDRGFRTRDVIDTPWIAPLAASRSFTKAPPRFPLHSPLWRWQKTPTVQMPCRRADRSLNLQVLSRHVTA